jgi:ketosteroid isomerase-like protein
MSRETVDVVEGFLAGADWDTAVARLHPDIEWVPLKSDPGYAVHRGHDDVRAWLTEWQLAFPDMRFRTERIYEPDDETVVVIGRLTGRGEASGIAVESGVYGIVFTVRSGKITRAVETARETALEAAGQRP